MKLITRRKTLDESQLEENMHLVTWFKECTLIWTLSEKHSTKRKMLVSRLNMNGKSSKLVDQRHHCSIPALSVPKTSLFQPTPAWPPLQSLSIKPKSQAKYSSILPNSTPYFPPDTTQVMSLNTTKLHPPLLICSTSYPPLITCPRCMLHHSYSHLSHPLNSLTHLNGLPIANP